MVKSNNIDSPTFLSAPPDGWRPRTHTTHDLVLFQCLTKCKNEDDAAAARKKNETTRNTTPATTPSMKSKLSIVLGDDGWVEKCDYSGSCCNVTWSSWLCSTWFISTSSVSITGFHWVYEWDEASPWTIPGTIQHMNWPSASRCAFKNGQYGGQP